MDDIDTRPTGGYEVFSVGIVWTNEDQTPFVMYVDETVVDTSPLSCAF